MREFIYLSPEKLNSFMSTRRTRRFTGNITLAGGITPGPQGSISVTANELDEQGRLNAKLEAVVKEIQRTALPYEDEHIEPGGWISFSGAFGYSIVDSNQFRLFLVTQTASTLTGETALLLYGNPKNVMVGSPPAPVEIRELDSYPVNLARFARDLLSADETDSSPPGLGARNAAANLFFRVARGIMVLQT